ncbi:M28 family peptidase [Streptomyces dangxiongensis]|uniref:M28 family peptidase n=1 Tax=Streptomyces dangxiongensis TaxID=1442032 RepID=A0A3G2J6A7_9ACTN|nr:M28 family peptidase [Streptomyces dangxiongensis]AYN37728.1 M28 family peptidase [Streptomyces dangxiongensis]
MTPDHTEPSPSATAEPESGGPGGGGAGRTAPGPVRRRPPWRARWASFLVAGLAVLVAVAGLAGVLTVPAPAPADAPAGAFSAGRAAATVEEISAAPHPVGSTEHDRVRDHLVAELSALGLRPEVRSTVSADTGNGAAMVARVENVYASLPGTAPTGRVLIVAHYDSAEVSPGASDDGIGVATIVEVARALTTGRAPRNDIGFLLTDAEEPGLMGARGFTAAGGGLGDPAGTVVLNLEARGTSGPVAMFETGKHAGALLPALTDRVPVATSLATAVYEILPQDSDFTVLRDAGATGLNFAVLDGSASYHTPLDSADRADRGSLQDMGSVVLAATRKLAAADLRQVRESSDATWFTLPGLLVRYPAALVLPLALLAAAGLTALLAFARRRGTVRLRTVAAVTAGVPGPLLLAAGTGYAAWEAMLLVRPHYAGFSLGAPYRGGPAAAGLALFAACLVPLWALRGRRRARGAVETALGVLVWFTLLALVTAVAVPGASYLFVWPALTGLAGVAAALRLPGDSPGAPALCALPLIPAAALMLPVAALLFSAVGLALASVPLVVVVLALLPAAPLLPGGRRLSKEPPAAEGRTDGQPTRTGGAPRRRRLLMPCAGLLLGVVLIVGGLAADGVDARRPSQVSLLYVLDADTGRALWASTGLGTHPWADRLVDEHHAHLEDGFPNLVRPEWRTGTAPAARVSRPTARVLSTERAGDTRTVRLRLGTEDGAASRLMLYADTTGTTVTEARVEGVHVPGGTNRPTATGPWKWGLIQVAPPADGVEVTLTVRGTAPLRLRLVAETPGLPAAALGEKPATVSWSADWSALTLAARAFTI